jgi:hypothetical protein
MAGAGADADAEPSHGRRRYVKLSKEERVGDAPAAGAEEICPGELNQAIQVRSLAIFFLAGGSPPPRSLCSSLFSLRSQLIYAAGMYLCVLFAILMQFKVRKCDVCWQELPPGYLVPADEPWSTGIFGCAEDPKSCTSYYTGHFYCCLPSRRFYFSHHRLYVLRMDRIRALLQEMLLFSFLRCSLMHAFPNSHACSCCGNYMDLQSCSTYWQYLLFCSNNINSGSIYIEL